MSEPARRLLNACCDKVEILDKFISQSSFRNVAISSQVCLLFGQMWVYVLADEQRPAGVVPAFREPF